MTKLYIDVAGAKGLGGNWYGYDDQTVSTPQTDYLVEPGYAVGGYFNPFLRPGYLSPANGVLTAMTPTPDAVYSSTIYDQENDDFYFAENGQFIDKGDGLDDTSMTEVITTGTTGTPVIMDIEIYQINGVRKFFYVFETGGNLEVGVSNLPVDNATKSQGWLTNSSTGSATGSVGPTGAFTVPTTSTYNFMRVADNSYAYIFADNAVHKIDGTTAGGTGGNVTANVLLFPSFFRISDAVDYRGNMFIVIHQTPMTIPGAAATGANFSTPCGVYIWNRQSTVISMSDYIPLNGVKAIKKIYVSPDGEIRLITYSANSLAQIRRYTGSTFEVIEELGLGGAPQYSDSLTVAGRLTCWLATDGSFYAHGPISPGGKDILARIGQIKAFAGGTGLATNISAGAVLYGGGSSYSGTTGYRNDRQGFTMSYNDGANKISRFYPFDLGTINSVAQLSLAGNVYSPVTLLPPLSKVNYIRVYHNTGSITGSIVQGTLSVFLNQSTTANITSSITRNDLVKGWKYVPINQGAKNAVFAIQFKLVWPTDVELADSYNWLPRMIEIDYDVIEKLK